MEPPGALAIDIAVEADAWNGVADLDVLVERAAVAAVAASGQVLADGAELSLVLCDDAFIKTLNRKWRGKDQPTNVLSFPTEAQMRSHALGDVVIAFETCAREAEAEGRALADHVTHLVVHGVFHLLGFDHESDIEADVMETLESQALLTLGIASPYQTPIRLDAEDRRAAP